MADKTKIESKTHCIVDAEKFCNLGPLVGKDESRYYLQGIQIEPVTDSEGKSDGVLMVATNGHAMGIFHDKTGRASEKMIVRYSDTLFRERVPDEDAFEDEPDLKWGHSGAGKTLVVKGEIAGVFMATPIKNSVFDVDGFLMENADRLLPEAIIHGTYPDWRRAVVGNVSRGEKSYGDAWSGKAGNAPTREIFGLSHGYFHNFRRIVDDHLICFIPDKMLGPIAVRAPSDPDFYGAIMPATVPSSLMQGPPIPDWLTPRL